MVLGIQVAGLLFGLFMLYYSFVQYKRKEFSAEEYSFWVVIFLVFALVSVFPQILEPITENLDFARTFDLLVIIGFLFLTGLFFYVYAKTKRTEKKLEKVVREIAMKRK